MDRTWSGLDEQKASRVFLYAFRHDRNFLSFIWGSEVDCPDVVAGGGNVDEVRVSATQQVPDFRAHVDEKTSNLIPLEYADLYGHLIHKLANSI